MNDRENPYATRLEELGFERYVPQPDAEEKYRQKLASFKDQPSEAMLRHQRVVKPTPDQPCFFALADITMANDGTGQMWVKLGHHDLTPYGFYDIDTRTSVH